MPNTREKLIELMKDTHVNGAWHHWGYEESADHLIANGVTVQKWIPVTERLPEKDGDYIVYKKRGLYEVLGFAKDGRKIHKYDFARDWKNVWYSYDSEYGYCTTDSVTHWMELPEPPKGE